MCFGSKEKQLYNDSDDAPRPAPGQFPQQPTYADAGPKASMPQQVQQPYYSPQAQSPVSPQYQAPPAAPYQPPAGPPPAELSSVTQSNPPAELSSGDFAPPPGPPPSHNQNSDYAPPSGPPPGHNAGSDFAPPPGPPPSHAKPDLDYTAPPPGAPPKHDWEIAVPDTSLFPPPPAIFSGWYTSPTSNATEEEAKKGEAWCEAYPLIAPLALDSAAISLLRTNSIRLMTPTPNFLGTLTCTAPGVWSGATQPDSTDSCILGYPPLYSVREHSPLATGRPKTIYYEVLVKGTSSSNPFHSSAKEDICLAIGFTALPYPNFRMPGWHRGSLAVHGDDGHKFINDRWGGKSFTEPFRRGETYGIGMTFTVGTGGRIETNVFFTRQGRMSGGWNLHEETDAKEDLPVTGLEGYHDLSCAVGTYKAVAFDVVFDPARWLYKPENI
ncbi:hypothetical protein QBC34DRAFT_415432 [Podospora aff. communis PSN243]|uniref:SPRY domain-containing protein n=1 Tax=Podospora aff. communis PSN243 TaxID=3040156 RepID=A0AAV9G780_9PEZI|nr:hypothetical protein QBC34DRAFT_415432 [Podospora aff. communis PSN243]